MHFRAARDLHFEAHKSGNALRGAFGALLRELTPSGYERVFRPAIERGPSGLRDAPRPFVFRASHLDGSTVSEGDGFYFDVHLFDASLKEHFTATFARFERAKLEGSETQSVSIDLAWAESVRDVRVEFVTPTELKADGGVVDRLDFGVLFARVRDRVATLRALYGAGPLDIDFQGMGERAAEVELVEQRIERVEVERRSSRTGQRHSIGGFVGEAQYRGELGEFIPYLRAGEWTGIGRQTVWGKGAIRIMMNDVSEAGSAA